MNRVDGGIKCFVRLMQRLIPGAKINVRAIDAERIWFLPTECDVVESIANLRGRAVRCQLRESIPLRNMEISQIVLLVDSNLECDVYMGLSGSLTMDPILFLGRAKVA